MVNVKVSGSFKKTNNFLSKVRANVLYSTLDKYAQEGIAALQNATPKDSGKTAASWVYRIEITKRHALIVWDNLNRTESGIPIVVLIQYGHGTRNGGYVEGRDFINPAIQPVFDKIAKNIWMEVTNS